MENPPAGERVLHAGGDIVFGNTYRQSGQHNTVAVNHSEGISQAGLTGVSE